MWSRQAPSPLIVSNKGENIHKKKMLGASMLCCVLELITKSEIAVQPLSVCVWRDVQLA
jgi:hypothetical protein